jgi:two-component system chemotaxis response regulator CheY
MKFRFIVIDDAVFIREILKNITEGIGGHCVGEAENGREALELVRKTLPDLIYLDLVMPMKNGFEIIDEIKEIWPEAKIVVCSTLDQPDIIKKLNDKSIAGYFSKPFSKIEIEDFLKKELGPKEQKNV